MYLIDSMNTAKTERLLSPVVVTPVAVLNDNNSVHTDVRYVIQIIHAGS